jgi:hypothetical protein
MYDKQIAAVETSFQTIDTLTDVETKRKVKILLHISESVKLNHFFLVENT